jgi:uncharacterized phage-associated protein
VRAIDAANFFIDVCAKSPDRDYMTNLRLHKLLFYAQGWSLVLRGAPLFGDVVEAWQSGPVVPAVFGELRINGKNPIMEPAKGYSESDVSDEDAQFLIDVLVHHESSLAFGLVDLTRTLPCWRNHQYRNEDIPLDEIRADFETLTPRLATLSERVQRMPVSHGIPLSEDFDE